MAPMVLKTGICHKAAADYQHDLGMKNWGCTFAAPVFCRTKFCEDTVFAGVFPESIKTKTACFLIDADIL